MRHYAGREPTAGGEEADQALPAVGY
jgi:hypothetical protein